MAPERHVREAVSSDANPTFRTTAGELVQPHDGACKVATVRVRVRKTTVCW